VEKPHNVSIGQQHDVWLKMKMGTSKTNLEVSIGSTKKLSKPPSSGKIELMMEVL